MSVNLPTYAGKLGRWATSVVNDPTTGKDNAIEPTEAEKDSGWVPYRIKPKRYHMNWLFNANYGVNDYLMNTLKPAIEGLFKTDTFAAKVPSADLTSDQNFTLEYTLAGDMVTLKLPFVSGTSNSNTLRLQPQSGDWPLEILPSKVIYVPATYIVDNGNEVSGALFIRDSSTPSADMVFNISNGTDLGPSNFTASGIKGFATTLTNITITYAK